MNITDLISDVGKIIVFLTLLLSIFLITLKSTKKLSNCLFAAFLLVTAIDLTGLFLPLSSNTKLASFKIASVLLQMPLYYLYVRSICYSNFRLKPKDVMHSILFVGGWLLLWGTDLNANSFLLFEIIAKLQYYAYIIAVFVLLKNYKQTYQDNYSSDYNSTYKWLFQITSLFLIGNCFVLLRHCLPADVSTELLTGVNLLISTFALGVICWFVLKALYQPNLFLGIDERLAPMQSNDSLVLQPEDKKIIEAFSMYMLEEKPYLDSELSLEKLAISSNIPKKELSQLINQQFGKHFFDYINGYRIEEAKMYLREHKSLTVLEILYTVGFNSKSSFYTAFKKETKQTPSAYRKSMR